MALAAATIFEVAATGSDGNAGSDTNSGGFNPTNANSITNVTTDANTGNTATPVISSASYNFVAGDVNHWVFIQGSGTWTLPTVSHHGSTVTPTGIWVKISSVASNKATLDAAAGKVICYTVGGPFALNTTVGVSTEATPTSGKMLVDYSQCGTPKISVTDAVTAGTTTITSAAAAFANVEAGNLVYVSGGTGSIAAAVYEVVSVTNATTIVVDRSTGLSVGTGATLKLGGCLASPGQGSKNHVAGNKIFVKNATYTVTSASANVAAGCVSLIASNTSSKTKIVGYNAYRSDAPKTTSRPLIQASGISTFTLVTFANGAASEYVAVDGAGLTSSQGFAGNSANYSYYCTAKNCTNRGFNGGACVCCDATGCSSQPAFYGAIGGYAFCVAWSNTATGFAAESNSSFYFNCLSVNNSGASSDGFLDDQVNGFQAVNCTAYGNGRDGFRLPATNQITMACVNCIAYGNTGTNFNVTSACEEVFLVNCAAGNGAANFSTNLSNCNLISCIALTADPFTASGSSDFSLNSTAGGGTSCRGAGIVGAFPGLASTSTYLDLGAVDHQDPAGGAVFSVVKRSSPVMKM